ncbi:MAG: c-type cytochrome [Pseudomonadota bacterium]
MVSHQLRTTAVAAAAAIAGLAGCGEVDRAAIEALPTAADVALSQRTGGVDADIDWEGQDPERLAARGKRLFAECQVCHQVGPNARNGAGPGLYRLLGRPAGQVPGFAYSAALKGADFTWTPSAFDAWIAAPWRFLPGTNMQYGGLSKPEDRLALLAYLEAQNNLAE